MEKTQEEKLSPLQKKLHEIIFEADTPIGKFFDLILIICIILSIIAVMLESVEDIASQMGPILKIAEWVFTIMFTVEYLLRIYCIGKPSKYIKSFYGIIDLLAILPTYVSLFVVGTHYLIVIRALRILRVFRILKLAQYLGEAALLSTAIKASGRKIFVFIFTVIILVTILGSFMYLIESKENGFTSIPRSIYWAIVTLTTVGYGDISPQTPLGQALASIVMITGYAIIAVPTGIVTVELNKAMNMNMNMNISTKACLQCSKEGHDDNAEFCKFCGAKL